MMPRVGVAKRCWAFYEKNGVGVAATATCDYHDEAANWVTGAAVTAGGRTGWYYIDLTPDAQGAWGGCFTTASDVDQKEIGFEFFVGPANATPAGIGQAVWDIATTALTTVGSIGKLASERLEDCTAAIFSAAVWDGLINPTRTLSSFGTLAASVATAVWASGTRTLTSLGTVVADIWAYVTRTLTSVGVVTHVGPVPLGTNASIVRGDSYNGPPGNVPLTWSSADWPSLVDAGGVGGVAAVTFTARRDGIVTLTKACVVTGAGTALQTVSLSLTAAETDVLAPRVHVFDIQATWTATLPALPAIATLVDRDADGNPTTLTVTVDQTRPAP